MLFCNAVFVHMEGNKHAQLIGCNLSFYVCFDVNMATFFLLHVAAAVCSFVAKTMKTQTFH